MTNPNNLVAFDDVRRAIKGVMIEPAIVTEDDFKRFMSDHVSAAGGEDRAPPAPRPAEGREAGAGARRSICCRRI